MIRFQLFQIPVSIHWMFFLLTAFLGGGLNAKETTQVHMVLVFMVAAFISILVHELGHAFAGIRCGARTPSIQLHGLGGLAQFPGAQFSRKQNILVTAAGPAASILLAILFLVLSIWLRLQLNFDQYVQALLYYFVSTMVLINSFWTIVNLFPILPLDGGQILRDALGPARLKITCIIGFIALTILGLGLWLFTRSIFNLVIVAFLGSHTWKMWQLANGR